MNNKLIKKICLGTVQFGMDYGIANKTGKAPKKEVFKILDFAKAKGIETLDTAYAYGCSEEVLGEFSKERGIKFDIVSKISKPGQLMESLSRLGEKSIYGCLIHNPFPPRVILRRALPDEESKTLYTLWLSMKKAKENSLVRKIGFSFYKPKELEMVWDEGIEFDIVQIPYNVFDRRFEPYFKFLKEKGVEVHTRSVFLQGLFFMNPEKLPENLKAAKEHLELLGKIAEENNISISSLCLNFALMNPYIDKVVIGVDSLEQLKQNVDELLKPGYLSPTLSHPEPTLCHPEPKAKDLLTLDSSALSGPQNDMSAVPQNDRSVVPQNDTFLERLKNLKLDNENILLPYKWKEKT